MRTHDHVTPLRRSRGSRWRGTAFGAVLVLLGGLLAAVSAATASAAPSSAASSAASTTPVGAGAGARVQFRPLRVWDVSGSLNSGFGVSRAGQVYFYDRVASRIHQYGPAGRELRSWQVEGYPSGLAVAPGGRVLVLEHGRFGADPDRVLVFSPRGVPVSQFEIEGHFTETPIALALAPNGDVYVAGTTQVVRFARNGTKRYDWGDTGNRLSAISDLTVAPNGTVLVADRSAHRVKRFGARGVLRKQWGQFGTGRGQFGYPESIDVDGQGRVYVADPGQHTASRRVQVFGPGGAFRGQFGGAVMESTPRTVRVDRQGRVFVYDDGSHWGTYIRSFRQPKALPRIVPNQIRIQGRATKVRIRCTQGQGPCRGKLRLQHRNQNLASRNFTVKAGNARVFNVRLTPKGRRILNRQNPQRVRVVANPNGAKRVTKMVRVR